jgi:hypothetical protein
VVEASKEFLSDAVGGEVYGFCFRRLSWKVVMLLPSHDSMMLEVSRVDASTVSQQPAPFRVQLALAIALARARSASSRSRGEDDELNRWKKKVRGCEKFILFLCEEEVAGGVRTEGRKSDNYERTSPSLNRKRKSYEENLCDTCSVDVLVQLKC